jgi:hypothetical protein
MRPPPESAHDNVVYASLANTTFTVAGFIKAARAQFDHAIAAVDVFLTAKKIALAFTDVDAAKAAAETGLVTGNLTTPLVYRASRAVKLTKFTVSNTNCTRPQRTASAIVEIFSKWGKVVDVTPRFWRDSPYHTGAWHVTIVAKGSTPPPEILDILGRPAYVDIPGIRRVCRHCKTEKHTKDNCRAGQMARRERGELDGLYNVPLHAELEAPELLLSQLAPGHTTTDKLAPLPSPFHDPGYAAAMAADVADFTERSLRGPAERVTVATEVALEDEVGPGDSLSQVGESVPATTTTPAAAPASGTAAALDAAMDAATADPAVFSTILHPTSLSETSGMETESVIAVGDPPMPTPGFGSVLARGVSSAFHTVVGRSPSPQ